MTQNNIKIAITGGICSGKSTVAQTIREQGYSVVSCDEIYSELLKESHFLNLLEKVFGNIKNDNGTLNRTKLSEIVFSDRGKLEKLNSITHPQIMQRAISEMEDGGINFCEVPLLFEGGFERLFDNVIVVLRDDDIRVEELVKRNKINEKQALSRINSQFNYKNCDFTKCYVINNNSNLVELQKNTLIVLEKIRKDYI